MKSELVQICGVNRAFKAACTKVPVLRPSQNKTLRGFRAFRAGIWGTHCAVARSSLMTRPTDVSYQADLDIPAANARSCRATFLRLFSKRFCPLAQEFAICTASLGDLYRKRLARRLPLLGPQRYVLGISYVFTQVTQDPYHFDASRRGTRGLSRVWLHRWRSEDSSSILPR